MIAFMHFLTHKHMSFSQLPIDVHNEIYSFLPNKDLYHILTTSRETYYIADRHLQPHINDNYAIRSSSRNQDYMSVKKLLKHPLVDPSANKNEAFKNAAQNGHTEIVKILLEDSRVDPSDNDNEAFKLSSSNLHVNVVKLLLQDPRVDSSSISKFAILSLAYCGLELKLVATLIRNRRVCSSTISLDGGYFKSISGKVDDVIESSRDISTIPFTPQSYFQRCFYVKTSR